MDCTCNDWKKDMPDIKGIFVLGHLHGIEYKGEEFRFCPWCGGVLVATTTVPPVDGGENMTELKHGR